MTANLTAAVFAGKVNPYGKFILSSNLKILLANLDENLYQNEGCIYRIES